MRVLVVSNYFPPYTAGGAEIVAYRQADAFRQAGHSVTVFCGYVSDEEPGFLINEIYRDIPVFRCRLRSLEKDSDFYWETAASRFRSILNHIKPDFVHFHNVSGLGVHLVAVCGSVNIPSCVTLHDYWGFCLKNTLLKNDQVVCQDTEGCATCLPRISINDQVQVPIRLRRDYVALCLSHATLLISPSRFLGKMYSQQKQIGRDVYVVSNGIHVSGEGKKADRRSDFALDKKVVDFVCFAHLGPHKGVRCLINAIRLLIADTTLKGRWTVSIAGHGNQQSMIEGLILEQSSQNHVYFHGKLEHHRALELLDRCDVQLLTSIWPENEPVSILESSERGKTQIASRIGGIPELIEHERSGLLFEPGDHFMLAEMMKRMILDPKLISQYSSYNYQRRHQLDQKKSITSILNLFEAVHQGNAENVYQYKRKSSTDKRFIVACSGGSTQIQIDLILANLYKVEKKNTLISFVWCDWVQNHMWSQVDALWIWSDGGAPQWDLALKALRSGLPIISAVGSRFELATRGVDHELAYSTWQNAFEILASLPIIEEDLRKRSSMRKDLARIVSLLSDNRHLEMLVGAMQ